ncbi:MAG: trigger factor [Bacilli bacterium]|nr:trigger factor [Bacilli bacterium]
MKNVKEITVKIEKDEWMNILKDTFNKNKKNIQMDGFRKGSVTWDLFIKKNGIESLYSDAANFIIDSKYADAYKESGVEPVVQPSVNIEDISENGITIKYTFISKPEVKLGEYKNLGIKREKAKVTKEEIENELESLRDKLAEIVNKEEGSVESGDTAVIDFTGVVDGKELDGGKGENYPLEIGSNTFIPGFEDSVIGMKVGETKDINLKFPENYVEDLKNKDVTFTVTVREIKTRVLPEINEDFYKDLGYEDVKTQEELEKKIKEHLLEHKNHDIDNKYLDEVLKKATENMTVEINEEIVHDEIHRMINQYSEQLKMQGLSIEQYLEFTKSTMEDLESQMHPEALSRVKERYLIEAVAEKENIEVTQEEVEADIERISAMYNIEKEEFVKMIGGNDMIKYDVKMRKALEFLKEN